MGHGAAAARAGVGRSCSQLTLMAAAPLTLARCFTR